MPIQSKVLHHMHIRKRVHIKKQKYPSKNRFIRNLDTVAYVMGVLVPAFAIPQLYEIWSKQSAGGVSIVTWVAYLGFSIFWTFYGVAHKEKPIIIMYASQAFLQIFIVWGILKYQ